jgi:hypothetical protein
MLKGRNDSAGWRNGTRPIVLARDPICQDARVCKNRLLRMVPGASADQVINRRRLAFEQRGDFIDGKIDGKNVVVGWCRLHHFGRSVRRRDQE